MVLLTSRVFRGITPLGDSAKQPHTFIADMERHRRYGKVFIQNDKAFNQVSAPQTQLPLHECIQYEQSDDQSGEYFGDPVVESGPVRELWDDGEEHSS